MKIQIQKEGQKQEETESGSSQHTIEELVKKVEFLTIQNEELEKRILKVQYDLPFQYDYHLLEPWSGNWRKIAELYEIHHEDPLISLWYCGSLHYTSKHVESENLL